jgi:fructose-1,6-bisphosphatase/inositol monophosphatase family enzyme
MSGADIDEIRAWAHEAGDIARSSFNRVSRRSKADRSLVTAADEAVEQFLRERINRHYPAHGIIGEEQGANEIDREFVWVIDPIDGTGAFVSGLGHWCVSIGLLCNGVPHMGVVYLPLLDDCYWAAADGPAYRNDQPINVMGPIDAIDPNDWLAVPSNVHQKFRIDFPGKVRSLSSIAADICYVARGMALGGLISRGQIWDIAGGLPILKAAGGVAGTLSGKPLDMRGLIEGRRLPEPLVVGAPEWVAYFRERITRTDV